DHVLAASVARQRGHDQSQRRWPRVLLRGSERPLPRGADPPVRQRLVKLVADRRRPVRLAPMADDVPHAAESVTAVAGEGGVAVSYVAPGTRVSPKAVVLLTVSALIFSTGGLFIRELDDPQAWRTVFWRSLGACFSLALLIVWRERTDPFRAVIRIGRPGWAVGAAFSASSIGMVVALTKTSVAIVLVIFALSPLAAAVMARIIIGERIRGYTWIAIGTTVAGVACMVSGPGAAGSAAGALIALIIPIAFGFGTVMIRRHSEI